MAARSLLRPMRRRVRTGTLIALRFIGAGLMLLPNGRGVVESGSTGAPPAPPSTQLPGTGGARSGAATPVERAAGTASLGARRGRADRHPRRSSRDGRDQRRIRPVLIRRP